MPTVKLTPQTRLNRLVERVKGVLLVHLPDAGLTPAAVRTLLADQGVELSAADLPAVRDALIADGTIEVIP